MDEQYYFIGVDVGTSSVRAGLFTSAGELKCHHMLPITIYNPSPNLYEQSSDEIWKSTCQVIKAVTKEVTDKSKVKGIGFDATCSLVVLDEHFKPISVDSEAVEGDDRYNVIMWRDHRASEEECFINSTQHKMLKYVGNKISLEMEMPKLLNLKKNMPATWKKAKHFIELPDFLTMKATGNTSRSSCSLVCKWNYEYTEESNGWNKSFLEEIGLLELAEDNFSKIGSDVKLPGSYCGNLNESAAVFMGLTNHTVVGASIIDAHAGFIGLLASQSQTSTNDFVGKLALICGTSTCHMIVSGNELSVPGIWGPYFNSILSNCWTNEGGQSATGALIDHIIESHPASSLCPSKRSKYEWLEEIIMALTLKKGLSSPSLLTKDIHVYPDFHGNRSPLSDANMVGMVCGLKVDNTKENLATMYLATLQSLAYGTRDIVDQLTKCGHEIGRIYMCGGIANSELFININANVLGLPILIPTMKHSVLLGSAILGATASGCLGEKNNVAEAASNMAGECKTYFPNDLLKSYHNKKYEVFKMMQQDQLKYRNIMQ